MSPDGAFNGVRERNDQYSARKGRLSKRRVEYESAIHVVFFLVNGTRCKASASTGDKVTAGPLERNCCTVGQMRDISSAGEIFRSRKVAMASLVLLSKITSKGANGVRVET